jgi:hypothetical protein
MHRKLLAFTLVPILVGSVRLRADDEGFRPLFNGKDLSGWVITGSPDLFKATDGEIVGRTPGTLARNEFLVADQTFGDFILKAKVKLLSGNSGIQFRSKGSAEGAVAGPQADVADGYWGLLYEERERGILERYPADKADALIKKGGWNEFEIHAQGNHVVILINGTKVIDRVDPKFRPSGLIALQVHVGPPMEVRYKDLMIKVLEPGTK